MTVMTKPAQRLKRRRRVRAKIHGTAERPRISVFRSNRGIFAQLIDDDTGRTIASVNWTEAELRGLGPMEQATAGRRACWRERAEAAGISSRGVRPRRLSVPRARQGARRRCPRGRAHLLAPLLWICPCPST